LKGENKLGRKYMNQIKGHAYREPAPEKGLGNCIPFPDAHLGIVDAAIGSIP
jgi:hypothetical protein